MKKVIVLAIVIVGGVYLVGRFNLGEAGAMRFMMDMESLMGEGKVDQVCDMFHDDLEVEIADHSGESTETVSGGKEEFCNLTRTVVAGLQMLPHTSNVDYTDVTAKRDWSRPWTSFVSYSEHRTLSIPAANVSLQTVSDDQITLVQTFSGVKLLKVKSEIFKTEAT